MSTQGPQRDLVVIGASAGGVEALQALVSGLPRDLPAAVVIALHLRAGSTSALAAILDAAGPLPATPSVHGGLLEPGRLYVALPDHHLLVCGNHLELSDGPAENGHRPSIDILFRSAAATRGPSAVGIILSGVLDDGTAGLVAIKSRGGLTIIQDPADAAHQGMPESALANVQVDYQLTAAAIGARLGQILAAPPAPVCPDCGRALSILPPGHDAFGCQTGHLWSADTLFDTTDQEAQAALWTAVRSLDDRVELTEQMAATARQNGNTALAQRYSESLDEARAAARLLRRRLTAGESTTREDGRSEL